MKAVVLLAAAAQITSAQIRILAVTDSAAFKPGLPSYGSLASVFCTGLTGISGIQAATQFPLPYDIAGVSVRVNGISAPLLAVADLGTFQQVNIQTPLSEGTLELAQTGQISAVEVRRRTEWGGVFFTDPAGYAIVQHADYSLVTAEHPARQGEVVVAYGTDLTSLREVPDAPRLGFPARVDFLSWVFEVRYKDLRILRPWVTVNGKGDSTSMLFVGLAPGSVGVFQMNFRIPEDTPDGDAILRAVHGSCSGFLVINCSFGTSIGARLPVRGPAPER
jgi:uncharacterized protein (TIGR03437 family)